MPFGTPKLPNGFAGQSGGVDSLIDTIWSRWDNPTMIVTLDSKRRLTLPAALLPAEPGQSFDVRFDADEDALIFRRLPEREDWLEVLAECPVPMDDLPKRRREFPKKRRL